MRNNSKHYLAAYLNFKKTGFQSTTTTISMQPNTA